MGGAGACWVVGRPGSDGGVHVGEAGEAGFVFALDCGLQEGELPRGGARHPRLLPE